MRANMFENCARVPDGRMCGEQGEGEREGGMYECNKYQHEYGASDYTHTHYACPITIRTNEFLHSTL